MVEVARERLQQAGARHLIDVYCGVGFFSLELADLVESFAGIELDRLAIQAARRNAENRGKANGEFIAATAEAALPGSPGPVHPRIDHRPARPSAQRLLPGVLEALRAAHPAQILYISCQPAIMARDLNVLCSEGGYSVEQVTPLDMFPDRPCRMRGRPAPPAAGGFISHRGVLEPEDTERTEVRTLSSLSRPVRDNSVATCEPVCHPGVLLLAAMIPRRRG